MASSLRIAVVACALAACDSPAPAPVAKTEVKPEAKTDAKVDAKIEAKIDAKTDAKTDTKVDTKTDAKVSPPEPTPPVEPTTAVAIPSTPEPTPLPPGEEIAIKAWSTASHTPVWTEKTAPAEPIVFEAKLYAGVLGQAGATWHQLGPAGELVPTTMDVEPTPPIMGMWPNDAWMVQNRTRKEDEWEYLEFRLMKLRGGDRWVPQKYDMNEQWFHPGTGVDEFGRSEYDKPHASTRSGLLMYPGTLEGITRVAGKHEDPYLGPHRGRLEDFFETGAGKIYIITYDTDAWYAQTECEDDACVATMAKKLPLANWSFGRRVSRGKHSVSVIATSGTRTFILHHRGKSDGWLLEELPTGEKPTGMWNSEEGGLWTVTGEVVRWRDTESAWRDVVLPAGLSKPSIALTEDRKTVWLAGEVGGAGKVFTTPANAVPPAG